MSKFFHIKDYLYQEGEVVDNFEVLEQTHRYEGNKNTRKKSYEVKCLTCGHVCNKKEYLLAKGYGCEVCSGRAVDPLINSIAATNPEKISLFKNPEDARKYRISSHKKADFLCPICGTEAKDKIIRYVMTKGVHCIYCSNSISLGERFMACVLRALETDYKPQAAFSWLKKKKYDFFIQAKDCIIEMHGEQHYESGSHFETVGGDSYEAVHANDILKETTARKYIKHYIVIDCRKSDFDYIEKSIKSNEEFCSLFDVSKVDFEECKRQAAIPIIEKVIKLWNKRWTVEQMVDELKYGSSSIVNWLNTAAKLGLCDYSSERANARKGRKVIDTTTNVIYECVAACSRIVGYEYSKLYWACKSESARIKNNIPVIYLEDYYELHPEIQDKDIFFKEHLCYEI